MVKFCRTDKVGTIHVWGNLLIRINHTPKKAWFSDHQFEIAGTVYNEMTDEFLKAFEQERVWEKLSK